MKKTKKKRKSTAGRLIVLLILLLSLAGLLALKYFTSQPAAAPAAPAPTEFFEEYLDSGVIIRPAQATQTEMTSQSAPAPTKAPVQQPAEEPQGAVILQNQGDLEIIIPEGMESAGF